MRRHLRNGIGFCMAAAALTSGCLNVTEPLEVALWDAEFEASDELGNTVLVGSFALVANQHHTDAGVGVSDLTGEEDLDPLGWSIRSGTCDSEGQPIATAVNFPTLEFNESGESQASMALGRRIVVDIGYVGEIFTNVDGTGEPLACVELRSA